MSEREMRIAAKLAEACEMLPEAKQEYLLGYAEGVAAAAANKTAVDEGTGSQVPS